MTWHWFWIAGYVLSLAVIPFILLANKRPAATLAWIWAVLLFPYAGPFFYLLMGSERMHRRRLRRRIRERRRVSRHARANHPKDRARRIAGDDPGLLDLVETLSAINSRPITTADEVALLVDGAAFYDALEAAIRSARKTIHMECFIWRDDAAGDRFRSLLVEAARRGVRVRLLLDEMGSGRLYRTYFRELSEAGGRFSWFGNVHPLRNRWTFGLRNHRKLQVIDGETAFVGGMNIGREYLGQDTALGPWHDLQVRVTGAVAA
ncbi:MAG TPA: phospholipase D-like domain-containing protein, partial [Candidatus Methylacidiphilales bacterium]